jgi:hypothetical protein
MATNNIKTQYQAFMHFFKQLDIEMVDMLLDDNMAYSDLTKSLFITKLRNAFSQFIEAGDDCLIIFPGACCSEECDSCGCSGFTFLGRISGLFMDLIVKEEQGRVVDIYDCSDFKSSISKSENHKRIKIDRLEFPF